jgi:prepilin-type N-terminal cleavage/methylation domain-containing protein
MSLKKNHKGFTLIELMIVVAIIGILAAVAVPKFADLVTKSKEASVKGSLGSVRSALSIYYGDTEGAYPVVLFTALTNANKYMPAVGGTASLGRYEVPAHTSGTGNIGHTGGLYANASTIGSVVSDTDANAQVDPTDATPLVYGGAAPVLGEVYLNCTHMDTKSQRWTSY